MLERKTGEKKKNELEGKRMSLKRDMDLRMWRGEEWND